MLEQLLIAGGGIAGLSAALAASQAGWEVRVFERAPKFSEFGAGVQLGPNVVRCLQSLGLWPALQAVAVAPEAIQARSALSAAVLGRMPLGGIIQRRYGAPYLTVHRADLHKVLLEAVLERPGIYIKTAEPVLQLVGAATVNSSAVTVRTASYPSVEGDALLIADGVWSQLRSAVVKNDQPLRYTRHLAYRALLPMAAVPAAWRSPEVQVWMGPRWHVVHYPVAAGKLLNLVVIVRGQAPDDLASWDHSANAQVLEQAMTGCCAPLHDLVSAVAASGFEWRLWPLMGRKPVAGPHEMANGLLALSGDAAHPMLPYLAQGAGMAIEDAAVLGQALAQREVDIATRLRRYALLRWQRNAQVQQRAWRNGQIFHAQGPVRWGRDWSMRLFGQKLMDMPWLYEGPPGWQP